MVDQARSRTLAKSNITVIAVMIFWLLAWPVLNGAFTQKTMGDAAAITLNLLLVSCLGLLYGPNRSGAFALLAATLTGLTFVGFVVIFFAFDAFIPFVTTPKPV